MIRNEILPARKVPLASLLGVFFTVLAVIGLLMVFDTTFLHFDRPYRFFFRTVFFFPLGLLMFFAGRSLDLARFQRSARLLVVASLVLVALLWTPLGREINNARRWLSLGLIMLQPSELVKIALVVYLADFLARKDLARKAWKVLPASLAFLGPVLFLVYRTPDLGTIVLCLVTAMTMILVAGIPAWLFTLIGVGGLGAVVGMIVVADYRLERVLGLFRSWRNPVDFDGAYHLSHALTAIGRGGVFGVGPGNARQKFFFLPEVHTDSVFAHYAETFGLVGSLVFLALFLAIMLVGFRVAGRARDRFSALLMVGLVSMFSFQAFMHMGGNIGILPLKGLTLPFISYGGSSLLATFFVAGLMINVAARDPGPPPDARPSPLFCRRFS